MVRDERGATDRLRRDYAAATGDDRELPAFAFGDSPEMADELLALILDGRKRATAALVADYEADGDDPPERGQRSIVLDGRSQGACVIETVQVRIGPLGSVDPAFAWDEGEGDRTLEDWLRMHRRFFARRCAALGLALSDELPVIFERFALAWPRDRERPLLVDGDVQLWERGVGPLPGVVARRDGVEVGRVTFRPRPGGVAEVVDVDVPDAADAADRVERTLFEALDAIARREGWSRTGPSTLWDGRTDRGRSPRGPTRE